MSIKTIIESFFQPGISRLVLTGAGISTYSGIPDYRGPNGIYNRNPNFKPITHSSFMNDLDARQRYWARSFAGWPSISKASPSILHQHLVKLEREGFIQGLITQNVDGLHDANKNLLQLHGSLKWVECTACASALHRDEMQSLLQQMNPNWRFHSGIKVDVASSNPDGDSEVIETAGFKYPSCKVCSGVLKPSVVFFGGNIPEEVRKKSFDQVDKCDELIVLGSSLSVYSAYRLVKRASDSGKRVLVVNLGATRADGLPRVTKLDAEACSIII